jgi:hypothetical protein
MFFSQLFKNKNVLKSKKSQVTIPPPKDESGTRKSTQAIPEGNSNPAITVALSKPNVYFVDLGLKARIEQSKKQKYSSAKRFWIPQSKRQRHGRVLSTHPNYNAKREALLKYDSIIYIQPNDKTVSVKDTPDRTTASATYSKTTILEKPREYRAKRQEDSSLGEELSLLRSSSNAGVQTVPVQALSTIIPAQSNIGDVAIPSDISGINSNKIMAMVPVKVDTPLASPSAVAMVSQGE